MIFSFECPSCKKTIEVSHQEMKKNPAVVKCRLCGDAPAPDIMTAYQNIGKTITELYGCCECSEDSSRKWLPKEVKL
ncbi:MAG TPA: hypothetical protein PKA28_06100 [Methylomusa anaerophila]|uniref:Uncharacterized protein n=1 Tax=Methylomusa anaerophila TaxID=1930071 RepID=A0A348ALN4_9FIRM|nr:hypothetical protein [Methylomusa anaerophila]BBB91982.1 hypothetical protein MAMMFC1_02667 [Methylomusa anaerophila]HML88005.1 hypothetical protein [Methylomusa anaerophila]